MNNFKLTYIKYQLNFTDNHIFYIIINWVLNIIIFYIIESILSMSIVEEAPTWHSPAAAVNTSASTDSSSDDSSDTSLGDRLQALLNLSEGLDVDILSDILAHMASSDTSESDDGQPKHRGVVCDSCHKSGFTGARFICGYVGVGTRGSYKSKCLFFY